MSDQNPRDEDESMFWHLCASVAMKADFTDSLQKDIAMSANMRESCAIAAFDMADAMLIERRKRLERP